MKNWTIATIVGLVIVSIAAMYFGVPLSEVENLFTN